MTEAAATKQASANTTLHVSVEHFYKNKASHCKQRQLNGIISLCFTFFLSIISAFVMYSDVFYQRIHWVENLFKLISLRVLPESGKTCYFHPVSTLLVLLSAMVSMSHIYC